MQVRVHQVGISILEGSRLTAVTHLFLLPQTLGSGSPAHYTCSEATDLRLAGKQSSSSCQKAQVSSSSFCENLHPLLIWGYFVDLSLNHGSQALGSAQSLQRDWQSCSTALWCIVSLPLPEASSPNGTVLLACTTTWSHFVQCLTP